MFKSCYKLNSIGINKLDDADIVRKIISRLPQQKYGSIITILHNLDDFSQMTPTLVIGKIVAFEMSLKMRQEEEPTSSKSYAFACDEHKKLKGKKAPSSSFSSKEHEEEDDEEEEENDQASTSSSKDEETV
jgi:ABC-type multidrug transport system ATPase subunit